MVATSGNCRANANIATGAVMAFGAKTADRFSFGILYVLVGVMTLWAGIRVINYGLEVRFLKDYLIQWDIGIQSFSAQQQAWPVFSGDNHVAYMEALTQKMSRAGIRLPNSNTNQAYQYRIERLIGKAEKIFVLCLHDRLVLYGLSHASAERIERALDQQPDLNEGLFQGHPGKGKNTYIGYWKL